MQSKSPFPPSKVLIIGGGPAGLVTYRNLSAHGQFENVTLYERRDNIGGVWYLDDPSTQTQPPRWPSPAYPGLIGNVLPEYLSFSQFSFPEREDPNQPFPTLEETHQYLRDFAEPFIKGGHIKLNIEVTRVEERCDGGWRVAVMDWNKQGEKKVEDWDAVIVAVGWYDHPVWPNIPGLNILREKGLARHSKSYQGPQGHEGKRVLVVGNANSGNDICAHLAPVALTPVYQSIRRRAFPGFPSLPDDRIHMVAPVASFAVDTGAPVGKNKINAQLQDGTTLTDIDIVYVATGYKPNPDFVHVLDPSSRPEVDKRQRLMRLVDQNPQPDTGVRVPSLHRHILYAYNPTLAFIGSPVSFAPFTINDVSSLWLALVWSLTIPLLSQTTTSLPKTLLDFESCRLDQIRQWRNSTPNPSALFVYSVLGPLEEQYATELRREIAEVKPEVDQWFERKWEPGSRRRMYKKKLMALQWCAGKGRGCN